MPSGGSGGGGEEGGTPGLSGFSLLADDGSSPIVVDCSDAPVVENVTATAFAGEYGAGQRVYFQVRYERDTLFKPADVIRDTADRIHLVGYNLDMVHFLRVT